MMMSLTPDEPSVRAQGIARLLAKLEELSIPIPEKARADSKLVPGLGFTPLEEAVLDPFYDDRDFELARSLIHWREPEDQWHVIRVLDDEKCPIDVSDDMIAPTLAIALGELIAATDYRLVRLESCRLEGDSVVVSLDGCDIARIEPIKLEPFNLAIRNRVRSALKGVYELRNYAFSWSRVCRLPGFNLHEREGLNNSRPELRPLPGNPLLLGFPANWAHAIRLALQKVGIDVKHHHALEITAAFFGASNWHQLVKHQDEINAGMEPVAVTYETSEGRYQRFYRTQEEALFAAGLIFKSYPETLIVTDFRISVDRRRVCLSATTKREFASRPSEIGWLPPDRVKCGTNDYCGPGSMYRSSHVAAAQTLLEQLQRATGPVSTTGRLYKDAGFAGLVEARVARDGLPAKHLVYVGDHALAINYVEAPDGREKLSVIMDIFKPAIGSGPKCESITMYKTDMTITPRVGGFNLTIIPEYERDAPIDIPFTKVEQVKRLIALTHAQNVFSYYRPPILPG